MRPYVWAYGVTTGRVDSVPLVIPLPARPKQLLTFFFADRYGILRPGCGRNDASPRVTVVGPQTHFQAGLSVFGRIDNFTIHFQPSGFSRLFGIPMTELTDAVYDAHAVIGREISALEHELGETPGFADRIRLIEHRLILRLGSDHRPDPVALAANSLFASNGIDRVSTMAIDSGLSLRQFERRFLAKVGVPPKLYARIVRFNAALDQKLRYPSRPWSRIATDQDYYDQMHLVHDCRAFTGESPSRFLAQLDLLPQFALRVRKTPAPRLTACQASHSYYPATPRLTIIPDVTAFLRGEARMTNAPPTFNADDESAVRTIVAEFANTWNRHDMETMHALDTEDVEWINVTGNYWRGKAAVYKGHDTIHRTIFAKTGMSVLQAEIRCIAPDVAVVVATMIFGPVVIPTGQELPELKTRGSFTMVKRQGSWMIAHFHNTTIDPDAEKNDPITWDETGFRPGGPR